MTTSHTAAPRQTNIIEAGPAGLAVRACLQRIGISPLILEPHVRREWHPWSSGREAVLPGLYFCGYYVSPTGMLREIGREAECISAAIALRGAKAGS
jgi:hypothetical protein